MSLVYFLEENLAKCPCVLNFLKKHSWMSTYLLRMRSDILYLRYRSLSPEKYANEIKEWYFSTTGHHLNLENPRTFNEKIQWLKLYDSTPLKTKLADKYLVREWVAEKIGSEYLIPLLGVWDKFDDIDFDQLPDQFVLKANHGSGWNLIVKDKATFDKKDAKRKFRYWMHTNYAYQAGLELQYRDISPKIIAEKYIENIDLADLPDYKVHCFGGIPMYIQYIGGRAHQETKEIFFDTDWNPMEFTYTYPKYDVSIPKPKNLDQLLALSHCLSEDFAYVRVDFYILQDGSFKFGELTFTPASGCDHWNPPKYDAILGELICLPPLL